MGVAVRHFLSILLAATTLAVGCSSSRPPGAAGSDFGMAGPTGTRPPGDGAAIIDSELAAAVELAEEYGRLAQVWETMFNAVFDMASDPMLASRSEVDSILEATIASYRQALRELPRSSITEDLVRSEERALDLLAEANQMIGSLGSSPTSEDLRPAIRLLVEAGNHHQAAIDAVGRLLGPLGLSTADFGF